MAQLKDLIVNGSARIIGDLSGTNIYATTFSGALDGIAATAMAAIYAATSGFSVVASSAGYATTAGNATYAKTATTAENAIYAGTANFALIADTANFAISASYAASANAVPWSGITNKVDATTSVNGLMTSDDKSRLYEIKNIPAYCSTASATSAKKALCDGYALSSNSYIPIIFENSNSYAGKITLNINTQGAKNLYINGSISSATNKDLPAGSYLVYYDGNYYYIRTDGLLPYIAASIDGITTLGNGIDAIHYAVCGTAGSTAAKVADCTGFKLIAGSRIIVNFANTNTVNNPTLNVNSTGEKYIKYNGNYINAGLLASNSFLEFIYDGTDYQFVGMAGGNPEIQAFSGSESSSTAAYYIIGQSGTATSSINMYKAAGSTSANGYGIYFTPKQRILMGAAWNDYAEFRQPDNYILKNGIQPGRVVKENGNGTLSLTMKRLERGCEIISDTYGFSIGKTNEATLPIAATGRVLAYPDKEPILFTIGAPVCSGINGTVSEMTEEEERKYPSRIIGTVSEIPNYEIWHGANDVEVNGRIWIRIR